MSTPLVVTLAMSRVVGDVAAVSKVISTPPDRAETQPTRA